MVFLVFILAFQALTAQQLKKANIDRDQAIKLQNEALAAKKRAEEAEKIAKYYEKQAKELGLDKDAETLRKLKEELKGLQAKLPYLQIRENTSEVAIPDKILFASDQSELKPEGKAVLKEILPLWAEIVTKPEYKSIIKEVTFEGHADTKGSAIPDENYLSNLKLTLDRAETVTQFAFNSEWSFPRRNLLRELVAASGRSNIEALRAALADLQRKHPDRPLKDPWIILHALDSPKDRRVILRLTFTNPLLKWNPPEGTAK